MGIGVTQKWGRVWHLLPIRGWGNHGDNRHQRIGTIDGLRVRFLPQKAEKPVETVS